MPPRAFARAAVREAIPLRRILQMLTSAASLPDIARFAE
jgi:hypothetical protein